MDVSVRGAGIFGLSVAWACARAGATVEVVDPRGAGAGASGGVVGALAPHVPENWNPKKQFQLESLLMAEDFWTTVTETGGVASGYVRAGRVQPLKDLAAAQLARERAAGATDLWGGAATWQVTPESFGWQVDSPSGLFVHDTLSAHLHPKQACAALVAGLTALGVAIVPEPRAESSQVLWATGVQGLEELSETAQREVGRGIKGQAALLQCDRSGLPQLFADTLHIIPHLDGTVAVGSTTEREFASPDQTDAALDDVLVRARRAVPDLRDAPVLQRWAGLRPRARSRAPMLGEWPGRPGHFIANGGFKIGFGMAPKVGTTMAALMLEGRNDIPQGFEIAASS